MINSLSEWVYLFSLGPFMLTFTHEFARLGMERVTLMYRLDGLMHEDVLREQFHAKNWFASLFTFRPIKMRHFYNFDGNDNPTGENIEMRNVKGRGR